MSEKMNESVKTYQSDSTYTVMRKKRHLREYDWAQLKDCSVVMPKLPGWFLKLVKKTFVHHEKLQHRSNFAKNKDQTENLSMLPTENIKQELKNLLFSNESHSDIKNSISDVSNTCKKQTFSQNHVNASLLSTGTIKQDLDSIEGLLIPKKDILNHFSFIDNNENSKTETDLMQTNYNDESLTQEVNNTISKTKKKHTATISESNENKKKIVNSVDETFLDSSEAISKINDDNLYDHGSFKIVDINQILKKETSSSNFKNESHTIDGMGYVGNSIS